MATAQAEEYVPGFFHFDFDLKEGQMERHKIEHLFKIHQQYRRRMPDESPEITAMENTLGVFVHVLNGPDAARDHFQNILSKQGNCRINTLANALHGQADHPDNQLLQQEKQRLLDDESDEGKLQRARAKCEQGYFASNYILEEVHNLKAVEVGRSLLQAGIEEGLRLGMSRFERSVCRYYLFLAIKSVYIPALFPDRRLNVGQSLKHILYAFSEFYEDAPEELTFHKAHALIELTTIFTRQSSTLMQHQGFWKRNEMMKQLQTDAIARGCDRALHMCPDDYEILRKVAGICTSDRESFNKAEEYVNKSLNLNTECNLQARKCKVVLDRKRAKQALRNRREGKAVKMWQRAYEYGKETDQLYRYVTPSFLTEMGDACHQFALHGNNRQPYLDEALNYGARALMQTKYERQPRTLALLEDCLKMMNRAEATRLETMPSGDPQEFVLYVMHMSKQYQKKEQPKIINDIATALERGWQRYSTTEYISNFIQRYTEWGVPQQKRLLNKVIENLGERNTEEATNVHNQLCRSVVENPKQQEALRAFCTERLTNPQTQSI